MFVKKIGEPRPCLVTQWGGVVEAVAQQCVKQDLMGRDVTYYHITVTACRGKGGKETYAVHGFRDAEDENFVLL